MTLKFPRFMMKQTLTSMNISKQNFMFVPYLPSNKIWSDKELYERYDLTSSEIDVVEKTIREMDYTGEIINV